MYTTYRLAPQELDQRFLESLKTLFAGKTIEISITEVIDTPVMDETEYLMSTEANRRHLLDSLEEVKQGHLFF